MKSIFWILLIPVMLYLFSSCSKSNNVTTTIRDTTTLIVRDTIVKKDTIVVTNPQNPIVGLWVGTFQITGATSLGAFYYSFNLFPDSTIIQQGGGTNGQIFTGKGTWSLSKDSVLSANLTNTDISQGSWTQHVTAKYSSTAGTLSNGTWTFTSGSTGSGTFSMKRVE